MPSQPEKPVISCDASIAGRQRLTLPEGEDFWVFGYGSLMWHPGFPHVEVCAALLNGYHRRFCVYSHRYRGTPERPGLVLGLDRGGSCRGLAYRVPAAEGAAAMDYLYEREMVTGVYIPSWLGVKTEHPSRRATSRTLYSPPMFTAQACCGLSSPRAERMAARW